jgi:hypothetical protein
MTTKTPGFPTSRLPTTPAAVIPVKTGTQNPASHPHPVSRPNTLAPCRLTRRTPPSTYPTAPNKPNLPTPKITLTPASKIFYRQTALRPDPEDKPKQTQFTLTEVTPRATRHESPRKRHLAIDETPARS